MKRKRIDINPPTFSQSCFAVFPREDDGAVRFDDFGEEFKVKFIGTLQWTVDAWVSFLAKGRGEKNIFRIA